MDIYSDGIAIVNNGHMGIDNGGGNDIFCFGSNWGKDIVEQLDGGSVTL